jgi:hypothetical protein
LNRPRGSQLCKRRKLRLSGRSAVVELQTPFSASPLSPRADEILCSRSATRSLTWSFQPSRPMPAGFVHRFARLAQSCSPERPHAAWLFPEPFLASSCELLSGLERVNSIASNVQMGKIFVKILSPRRRESVSVLNVAVPPRRAFMRRFPLFSTGSPLPIVPRSEIRKHPLGLRVTAEAESRNLRNCSMDERNYDTGRPAGTFASFVSRIRS